MTWALSIGVSAGVALSLGANTFHFNELNGWVIVVFALAAFMFSIGAALFTSDSKQTTNRYLCRTLALASATYLLSYVISALNVFTTGVQNERWVFLNRALGEFAWVYWAFLTTLGLLPLLLWFKSWNSNQNLVRGISFVTLVFSALFVRICFIINHSSSIPSSWGQFLWPGA